MVWKSGQVRQALGCGQSCCGRAAAVPVGQGVGCSGEAVFDPLGVGGDRVRVEAEQAALDVDPGLAVPFELGADGGVVQMGVDGGHPRAGVAEQSLDHVLRHAGVDQPGAEGVPEPVQGDVCGAAGLVVQADAVLPDGEGPQNAS